MGCIGGIIYTIGIDQSYSNFAYVIFDENKEVVDRGVLHTGDNNESNSKKQFGRYYNSTQEQLEYLYSEFKPVVSKYSPCQLVFEGLSFGSIGNRVFDLGGLFYFITTSLMMDGLVSIKNIHTITPTSAKKLARDYLDKDDQYEKDKAGNVVIAKNKKPKVKKMDKPDMLKALNNTKDKWIVDGYSASSVKIQTGIKDLPDAYWLARTFLKGVL